MQSFVETVAATGCETFIVHARKAWLQGLSPKASREVPPLNYDRVHRLKKSMPHLRVILNGSLQGVAQATANMGELDGVMLGRRTPAETAARGRLTLSVVVDWYRAEIIPEFAFRGQFRGQIADKQRK